MGKLAHGQAMSVRQREAPHEGTVMLDVYEIAFPERFIQPMPLKAGTVVGFGLFLSDHDGKGITQSLTLTPPGTACHMQPHLWPLLVLVDPKGDRGP